MDKFNNINNLPHQNLETKEVALSNFSNMQLLPQNANLGRIKKKRIQLNSRVGNFLRTKFGRLALRYPLVSIVALLIFVLFLIYISVFLFKKIKNPTKLKNKIKNKKPKNRNRRKRDNLKTKR